MRNQKIIFFFLNQNICCGYSVRDNTVLIKMHNISINVDTLTFEHEHDKFDAQLSLACHKKSFINSGPDFNLNTLSHTMDIGFLEVRLKHK